LTAQIAHLTASGAFFGAADLPKRRRAVFPETTGPKVGKRSPIADGTIQAKTAMPSRIR